MKANYDKFKKVFRFSITSIVAVTAVAIIISLFKEEDVLKRIFDFNYLFAAGILAYGVVVFFMPVRINKKNRLVDHSNYMEVLREEKEIKTSSALESIFWGICNILLIGVIEIILHSVV
jgi:hypothetical protein